MRAILSGKSDICVRDNLCVCSSLTFGVENWTSADVMILKEAVLLLRSENMAALLLAGGKKYCARLAKTLVGNQNSLISN